jgi:hypothetical protein
VVLRGRGYGGDLEVVGRDDSVASQSSGRSSQVHWGKSGVSSSILGGWEQIEHEYGTGTMMKSECGIDRHLWMHTLLSRTPSGSRSIVKLTLMCCTWRLGYRGGMSDESKPFLVAILLRDSDAS